MFKRTIWCLVLFYLHGVFADIDPRKFHSKDSKFERELGKIDKQNERTKRGIALVDEDFDIPPGESNGVKEYDGIFGKEGFASLLDGSGDGSLLGKDTTKSFKSISEHIQDSNGIGQEYINSTRTSISNILTQSTPEFPHHGIKNGSTVLSTTTDILEERSTKSFITSSELSDATLVSSGDGMLETKEPTTVEITTKSTDDLKLNIFAPNNCFNDTCGEYDIFIEPSDISFVPERSHLTLSCNSNITQYHMLHWYKGNGSDYVLLTVGTDSSLQLNVSDIRIFHSGTYKCIVWIPEEMCCNIEMHLTVYEVPLYKYHLIIIALIAATALLICILLAVRQSKSFNIYSKEFVKKHGQVKENLLWN